MTAAYLFSPDFSDDVDRRLSRHSPSAPDSSPPLAASERLLLERLRASDESAFAELFVAHTTAMYRVATALLGSSDAAADVVQSVMYRLWLQREQLVVRGALGAYLRVATVNMARNALRNDARGRAWAERAALSLTGSVGNDASDDETLEDRRTAVLEQTIVQLPSRTREIFLLWWGGELSYREIAEAMHITVKGVERGRARALDALRTALIAAGLGPTASE